MAAEPRVLRIYETAGGRRPFSAWLNSLKDYAAQGRILARLERVRLGLLGDCKPVGEGVSEMRVDIGFGYRLYFGEEARTVVILPCGGSKATQRRDLAAAERYWKDYRSGQDADKRALR